MPDERIAKCGVDVVAGVIPWTPEEEFTRRWFITNDEWNAKDADQAHLLCDMAGQAAAYATYLMLQPTRFNWVKLEWMWL